MMRLRLRYRVWKLRVLCWLLQRLRAGGQECELIADMPGKSDGFYSGILRYPDAYPVKLH